MSWSLLSSGATGFVTSSAGFSYSLPGGAPSAGVLEVLFITTGDPLTSVGNGGGANWNTAEDYANDAENTSLWRVTSGTEGSTIIITHHDSGVAGSVRFTRWSGQAATSPLDTSQKSGTASGSASSPSISSGTLAGTGELVIAFAGMFATTGQTPTTPVWSAGLTDDGNGAAGETQSSWSGSWGAYNTNAGTASQTAQASWSGSTPTQSYTQLMAFKPSAIVNVTGTLGLAMAPMAMDLTAAETISGTAHLAMAPMAMDLTGTETGANITGTFGLAMAPMGMRFSGRKPPRAGAPGSDESRGFKRWLLWGA
jgi:hypothetical protein